MKNSIRAGMVALAGTVALTTGGVVAAQAAVGESPDPAKREDSTTSVVSTVDDTDPMHDPDSDVLPRNTVATTAGSDDDGPSANTAASRQTKASAASKASKASRQSAPTRKSAQTAASRQSANTAR